MKKYCVFFLVVLITKDALGMDLRSKRQAQGSSPSDDLEDRYGWNRPTFYPSNQPQWQMQNPNQGFGQWAYPGVNMYPGQGRPNFGQYPNFGQFPNNGQFPNIGQFPNNGQFPNIGQFPNNGQFPNIGQFPNNGQFPNIGQFPPNNGQLPNQGGNSNQGAGQQTTTQAPIDGSSTPAESNPTIQDCIRSCPVTAEYNPVCGSNSVTYPNPGRLMCAQACGISVSLTRSSPCPATTTAAPVNA